MHSQQAVEQRLEEYAAWRNQDGTQYPTGDSVFGRIQDMQENAGLHGDGFKPDIIDGVPCRPDGGLARRAHQLGWQIDMDQRCSEIHDLVQFMPSDLVRVLEAAYIGPPLEVPRPDRDAASRLKMSLGKYQRLKFGLVCWFRGVKFRSPQFEALR